MEGDWDNWGPGWDPQQQRQPRASHEDEARVAQEEGEEASSGGTAAKRRFSLGLLGKKIASAANNLGEAVARWALDRRGASHCCGPPCTACARVVQCCCLCAHFPPPGPWYCTPAMLQNSSCGRRGHCRCGAALPLCAATQRGRQEGGSGRGQRWAWWKFAAGATELVSGAYSGLKTFCCIAVLHLPPKCTLLSHATCRLAAGCRAYCRGTTHRAGHPSQAAAGACVRVVKS